MRSLLRLCLLVTIAACGAEPAATAPGPDAPPPPADTVPAHGDSTRPWPIDAAAAPGAPASYRGLPLGLVTRPAPPITPVDGVIGVVCVGMSNAVQECNRLIAAIAPTGPWGGDVSPTVRVVNCALGGHAIERWIDPAFDAVLWRDCLETKLPARGVRPDQVRVLLHKAANQFGLGPGGAALPQYPHPDANYWRFQAHLTAFAARVPLFFPSVRAVYTSARSYGGFTPRPERGEPQAYEEGHALNRWLAANAEVGGVWHGWWGYLWAPDCASGRRNGSGVCYERSDYQADAVHPTAAGEIKIARLQHDRLRQEPWYRR